MTSQPSAEGGAACANAWCTEIVGGVRLALQVTPHAKQSQVVCPLADVLKLRLQAQAYRGQGR